MHPSPFRPVAAVLFTFPLVCAFGCGTRLEPTRPGLAARTGEYIAPARAVESLDGPGGSAPGFYPLQSGNHWDHARVFSTEVRPTIGTPSRDVFNSTIANDQTCDETVFGRSYLIERVVESGSGGPFIYWIHFRQDRTGLYEADLNISDRPACESLPVLTSARSVDSGDDPDAYMRDLSAGVPSEQRSAWVAALDRVQERRFAVLAALGLAPSTAGRRVGAPPPGELLRLSYPLRIGAEWILRPDPGSVFTERVEGVDALHTPAGTFVGYRIGIFTDFLGPADHVSVWYGRQGFLQLEGHFESLAVDNQGNVYGTVVSDEQQTLTALSLVGAPGAAP